MLEISDRPIPTSSNRKIDPTRRQATQFGSKPDGSPDNPNRAEIGPTDVAFAEWAALGLTPPNLTRMRQTRLDNIVRMLNERDLAGVVLFDPLNIRYATDSTNMQLWTAHNPARAALVTADGYMVLWDFHNCEFMSAHLDLIQEVKWCQRALLRLPTLQRDGVRRRFRPCL